MIILHTETLKKWGGEQNRVLYELLGLSRRGHKVVLICNAGSVLAGKANDCAIKTYELTMSKKTYPGTIMKMIDIIRRENVEIVATHGAVDSWAGAIAAKLTRRKLVRFRHNLYPIGRDPLTRLIYTAPDKIVAVSDTVKDVLIKCGLKNERITIIHDSVDREIFSPAAKDMREELKIPPETLVIGNTSTFTEVKGQKFLLQAFNHIAGKTPCVLLFAGGLDEPSKEKLLSHVREGLRDKVIFLGHREDIPRVLATLDIFVFPSFLEGLGTALLEAMAMEKPVAVSDIPTFRSFVRDRVNGVFFSPGSPEDIAEKVISLIGNPELRRSLGREARTTILREFMLDSMIDKTETLYLGILNA